MERLGLGSEMKELKIGASFRDSRAAPSFHALKCDFKPASVDPSKMGTVEVGSNNQVTVTVPHLDGSGVPRTVFKGGQRPCRKECVLIIDRITGQMTLEKLSANVQVKKTRQEPPQKPIGPAGGSQRPHTPVEVPNDCTQRSSSWTRVTSGGKKKTAINPPKMSPPKYRSSPPQAAPWTANSGQSTLASLPMIGLDDATVPPRPDPKRTETKPARTPTNGHRTAPAPPPEAMDSVPSSSGSSGSDSDSDDSDGDPSGSDADDAPAPSPPPSRSDGNRATKNVPSIGEASVPVHLLNDDLCLSESGSDSD